MANHNREDAEGVFLRRLKDLGLNAGASFYANEIDKQAAAIVSKGKLTSAQYYMLTALVEDVAFRCLNISPAQPWIQSAQAAQKRLAALDLASELVSEAEAFHKAALAHAAADGFHPVPASFGGGVKVPAESAQVAQPTIDELIANDRPD